MLINKDLIITDAEGSNELDVITLLAQRAKSLGYISEVGQYVEAVQKREKEFSTAFGYGVAIPHGETDAVKSSFLAFCRPAHDVPWGENKTAVNLVFMIGVPKSQKSTLHLKILANLSRKLLDDTFRHAIALCPTSNEIFKMLAELEREITIS
ncbi:fructose PTS transporter subunit IIA [Sporolactobacillus shoreicorticis]|uniref:Fructose PTS transporter subunit IIA n=1 Tax=Sporolactobacillus shoreicorticis TaxID=1923877 RepID=A0ABW5S4P7_9BACL|nr:fructose PTS transporter subunit IIA [Sporolactobacillus shoreicorticis]MCO7124473.1 fructose PTS transporter subunit IIA [Sporolactobacillus shoreicorticis]